MSHERYTTDADIVELEEVLRDKAWWLSKIPSGYSLHGWTGRSTATVVTPGGAYFHFHKGHITMMDKRINELISSRLCEDE